MPGKDRFVRVLSILSTTRAFIVGFRVTALSGRAEAFLAAGQEETLRALRCKAFGTKASFPEGPDPAGAWRTEGKTFRLERTARRLTGSLAGAGGQILLDADLQAPVPGCPGICRCAARMDWNGEEILFPPATSVCFSFALDLQNKEEQRFGCSCAEAGRLAAFQSGPGGTAAFPKQPVDWARTSQFRQTGVLLPDPEERRRSAAGCRVEFGTWSVLNVSFPPLLGLRVSPQD